jgi:hypothetical protein
MAILLISAVPIEFFTNAFYKKYRLFLLYNDAIHIETFEKKWNLFLDFNNCFEKSISLEMANQI